MATELTYNNPCDVNRSVADQSTAAIMSKWTIWYFVQSLLGNIGGMTLGLWTLDRSCDGVTMGAAADGVDRLGGATFASAKIVQAAKGTAHSCAVLKAPAGLNNSAGVAPYMIIECDSATTTTISLTFCKTAPSDIVQSLTTTNTSGVIPCTATTGIVIGQAVTGTGIAASAFVTAVSANVSVTVSPVCTASGTNDITFAGSIKGRPGSPDEWSYATIVLCAGSVASNNRVSMNLSSRGDFSFTPVMEGGTTSFGQHIGFTLLAETSSADVYPWASMSGVAINGVNAVAGYQSINNPGCIAGETNALLKGRNFSGSALPVWMLYAPSYVASSTATTRAMTATDGGASNVSTSKYNDFPCYVVAHGANMEKKGRWPDVTWASGGVAQVQCSPAAAPFEYTKAGHLWLPWVASAVPVI